MKRSIDSVIFDLDGTLWDTCSACAVAWNNVVKRNGFNFRDITAADVRKVTGKPHDICIRETFNTLSEEQIQIISHETMLEDNLMVEKMGGDIYEGVAMGLQSLSQSFPLLIVSNCQSGYIETFFKFSGLRNLFRDFECWGNTGKSKGENLSAVIARNSLKSPVMVGDMESDLIAAQKCEVPFLFMKYGFGTVNSFDQAFDSFDQLSQFLIGTPSFDGEPVP